MMMIILLPPWLLSSPLLLLHLVFVLHVFELVLGPGHVDGIQYGLPAVVLGEEDGRFRDWLHPGQLGWLRGLPEVARHLRLLHVHQPLLSAQNCNVKIKPREGEGEGERGVGTKSLLRC